MSCARSTGKDVGSADAEQRRAQLLSEASALMAEKGPRVARSFYEQLLRRHPRMASFFADADLERQSQRMASILESVIGYANCCQQLGTAGVRLGLAHRPLGLTRQDYADFNETLADTLARHQATEPLEVARGLWRTELDALADVMLIVGS